MSLSHIGFYSKNANALADEYNSLNSVDIHQDWLVNCPSEGFALDVGAGSGRDAYFLAEKGLFVTAVEPSTLIVRAKRDNAHPNIIWLEDSLPSLSSVTKLQVKYDVILLSAVWMHILPEHRLRAIRKLSNLLKPNGRIIISLRFGPSRKGCPSFSVSTDEIMQLSNQFGLQYSILSGERLQPDRLGRNGVSWQTVQLTLPDDGTGAFPLLRHIVVNDDKSSTYKIGLLRSLLRIAEGHPGAVLEHTEQSVVLPLGLVAFYWLKLYKPLIDSFGYRQTNDKYNRIGFIKDNGWRRLTDFSVDDFYIGASFCDEASAKAIVRTIHDIASTIKSMPAFHIRSLTTHKQIFEVEKVRYNSRVESLTLNSAFFRSVGNFVVPKSVWNALVQHSVWIEPALVNEWCRLMQDYHKHDDAMQDGSNSGVLLANNVGISESLLTDYRPEKFQLFRPEAFLAALQWRNPQHATYKVRQRALVLADIEPLRCVWQNTRIASADALAIDHAFPFSRWPNNDLWNLLPSSKLINAQKSDKLPSSARLQDAEERITKWWRNAWEHERSMFFEQANLALPNLTLNNQNYEDVFAAMQLQRNRLRDIQQLQEWGN